MKFLKRMLSKYFINILYIILNLIIIAARVGGGHKSLSV
jgi:hypothetical protein